MGKKKGKGKSQAQGGGGGEPSGGGPSSPPTPQAEQPPLQPPLQQQQQPGGEKKQTRGVGDGEHSAAGPSSPPAAQLEQPPSQQQQHPRGKKKQQQGPPPGILLGRDIPHTQPQRQSPQPPQQQQQQLRQPQAPWGPQSAQQQQHFTQSRGGRGRPQGFPQQPQHPGGFQQPAQFPPGLRQPGPPQPQQHGLLPQQQQGPPLQQQFGPPQHHWGPPMPQFPQGQPWQPIRPQQQQGLPFRPPSQAPQPQQPVLPPGMPAPQQPQVPKASQQQGGAPPQQQMPKKRGPKQQQQQQQLQRETPGPSHQRTGSLPQQQQQEQQPQPQLQPQKQATSTPPKEMSPPFGEGDCLKQMGLVKPGTKGRKIRVESNHLELNVGNLMQAVHYDVAITPDTPKGLLRDVMNVFGQKHYPNRYPAYDGRKNLYSPTKLPFGHTDSISDTIKVEGENRPKEFKVEIKFARMVDLSPLHDMLRSKKSPQDALQCLDIVLRNAPSNTCITAGRCFFTPPKNEIIQLGDGMEMYYGFYQSAIRGWKPLLNVDVAHKAFPMASHLLDLICELGSNFRFTMKRENLDRPINDELKWTLDKFLKQLKVKYEITGQSGSKRIHRVNGLGESPAKAQFKMDDGKTMTVEKYFQEVKRCRLKYPHLPTIWVGAKERDTKILLPLEFCTVVEGQAVNRKMNENQTSAMIKKSATDTATRKGKIMKSLEKAKYNNDPCIREFGFSVNNQFERLEARVLQPPELEYAENSLVRPQKGVWRTDRSKFLRGAEIKKWTVACVTRYPCKMEILADQIFKMGGGSGIRMTARATPPFQQVGGRQTLRDVIDYFKPKQDFDLIFVVVPNSGPQYSFVKQAAELNVGCLTQCIKERTLNKLNPQTVLNILLKVNSKMNGTNHTFSRNSRPPIMNRPCMIMGADVTHPSPDAKDIPSVAAVTASHDPKAFQYNICWRLQPPKVEIIEDLCNITVEQLKFFYSKTNYKPERIIFFRDGVSEGQFADVQRAEIMAIQKACKRLQPDDYEPKITFLVVQKRHHTRLFPTNPRDSEDRNCNVPAGTCVDTMITNPMMQDFYLVSHASIQGVAKPTKYCTLWDDNKMNNDDIEELTYHLCHMFTRCNRSVSYPAPTYYAHLAAARAKVYIENDKLNMDQLKKLQDNYIIKDSIRKEKPMFFV